MAREKEYLYEVETQAENGQAITAYIAYRRDRYRPWTVDINGIEMSPTYESIGHAQAYLRKHYGRRSNPNAIQKIHYATKSILFDRLNVQPYHR